MKIALLNLQYDNNYGGNLQRYALMTILQRMGHDVIHLNLRFNYDPVSYKYKVYRFVKRLLKKVIIDRNTPLFPERNMQRTYENTCAVTDKFYNKYIKHTSVISHKHILAKQKGYDVYMVGSDQVWRKMIAAIYGINTFFFDFLADDISAKRIAYGVSLGTSENELNSDDLNILTPLYEKFDAVSVREDSALDLFKQYGWNKPAATQVLDPTLLLDKEDYMELINDGTTKPSAGNMFCYILDPSEKKDMLISEYEEKKELKAFRTGLVGSEQMSIQQWLRSFYESEFVITDSFHGMVFSIIFNKPFKLIYNPFRGNARFESLMRQLAIPEDTEMINWYVTKNKIMDCRCYSLRFLNDTLQ